MPDYEAMYKRLFSSMTDAIRILQKAQLDAEEIFISSPEPELIILPRQDGDDGT